jgi:hypothetical protein
MTAKFGRLIGNRPPPKLPRQRPTHDTISAQTRELQRQERLKELRRI